MAYMKKVVDNKKGSGFVNLATGAKVIVHISGIPNRVQLSQVVFNTHLQQEIGVTGRVVCRHRLVFLRH